MNLAIIKNKSTVIDPAIQLLIDQTFENSKQHILDLPIPLTNGNAKTVISTLKQSDSTVVLMDIPEHNIIQELADLSITPYVLDTADNKAWWFTTTPNAHHL